MGNIIFDPYRSPVSLYYGFNKKQAKSKTAFAVRQLISPCIKHIEYLILILTGNPRPVICDGDLNLIPLPLSLYHNLGT